MSMDAELKAKWIAALRSGEFKQGEGMLHDQAHDAYCCLGVLCKVAGAEFTEAQDDDFCRYDYVPVADGRILSAGDDEELDKCVCEDFGIPSQSILIRMNDGKGSDPKSPDYIAPHSFAEIADYIEQNL